jgi:hypothetical protein
MNSRLLLAISSVVVLSSCSTSYKAQTPDDVYFSPAKPQAEYVKTETQENRDAYRSEQNEYYSSEDSYLRWKVRNPQRWSTFDEYNDYQWYAYNNPYSYNTYNSFNTYSYYRPWSTYWNSYISWNSRYNPYCHNVIVVNPKTNATVFNKIRTYTPGTYNNNTYNNRNSRPFKVAERAYAPNNGYNNGNSNSSSGSSLGNSLKKIFSNSNSYNNNNSSNSSSSDRPSRTYTPSSSSSSSGSSGRSSSSGSSGGSSGGGGGASRPNRGG